MERMSAPTHVGRPLHEADIGSHTIAVVEDDAERCCICLMTMEDPAIAGRCKHEFCFTCIALWANQSRRCPLCSADMADFLLHDLLASIPTKFFLPPLSETNKLRMVTPIPSREQEEAWQRLSAERDEIERQVERRREVYRHELYVKHIAANEHTGFRPNPSPREVASNPALATRAATFLARELRVWMSPGEADTLTKQVVPLLRSFDVRSEPAVQLFTDFIDTVSHREAEHLTHELYSYLRSPFSELLTYDEIAQYDPIPEVFERRSKSPSSVASSSHSRHVSLQRPRDPTVADKFVPSPAPGARRWDQADVWIDPEYAAWLDKERRQADIMETRRRRQVERSSHHRERRPNRVEERKTKPIELLPSSPSPPLRAFGEDQAGLSIRGAAERRQSLLERLAQAKLETAAPSVSDQDSKRELVKSDTATQEQQMRRDKVEVTADQSKVDYQARALREKLIAERKSRMLKEQLMARKKLKLDSKEMTIGSHVDLS